MSASLFLLLALSTAPAAGGDATWDGDSLYRAGRYEEAASAFARARQARPWDDTLLLKQFLACESAPRGCAHDAQVDAYYAEKNGSPYAGLMMEYLRGRVTVMEESRIRTPLSKRSWQAFQGDHPLDERRFYALVGEEGLARAAGRRQGLAWGLGASGFAAAFAAVVLWAAHPGGCGDRGGTEGCRAARAGYALLEVGGLGAAFSGLALGQEDLIPIDSARALAHRYNLADLRKRISGLDPFGEQRGEKAVPAGNGTP
jgi:hypothetical protein